MRSRTCIAVLHRAAHWNVVAIALATSKAEPCKPEHLTHREFEGLSGGVRCTLMVTPLEDAEVSNARKESSYRTITSTKGRRIAACPISLRTAPLSGASRATAASQPASGARMARVEVGRGTSTDKGLRGTDDRFERDRGLDSAPVVN